MRTTFFAATAAMAGAASAAAAANHRHAQHMFAKRGHAASTGFPIAATGEVCLPGCTTIWKTMTGAATLVPLTVSTVTVTSTNTSTVTITSATPIPPAVSTPVQNVQTTTTTAVSTPVKTTTTAAVVVPTPEVQRCPTPGIYTFPATTMTVTATTTVCGATTTKAPAGTHTVGGVTTVVTTQTTVTCPVATVVTTGGVTTSTIRMTEYVCPAAGTYTIGAHTTALSAEAVIVYPTPTTIVPGTYTKPQVVVTATETNYVIVCPYTSSGLPTSIPTPSPVSTPAPTLAPVSTIATPSSVVPSLAVPSSSVAPSLPGPSSAIPSASAPATPGNSKTEVKGTNDHFAITYGPYESSSGACKSASQVKKDIAEIKAAGFQAVRIYGTDCDTLVNVVPACVAHGLQIIAGVFVRPGTQCSIDHPEVNKQVNDLVAMNNWDPIRLLVIGNEAIMNHVCSAGQLAQLITDVKSRCSGFQGPVTIAETLNIWQQTDVSTAICPLVDVVGANIHAFFNPNVDAAGAGVFVKGQMDILRGICNKNVINLETGWKNEGPCNGKACPGAQDQAKAIASIRQTCGDASVFFSFDNEGWKPQDDQRWGLTNIFFSQ
ncbi:hypothetical protein MY11210_002409 [Beauveria gryllotalpidicola]